LSRSRVSKISQTQELSRSFSRMLNNDKFGTAFMTWALHKGSLIPKAKCRLASYITGLDEETRSCKRALFMRVCGTLPKLVISKF
jgi:hypothetical protein